MADDASRGYAAAGITMVQDAAVSPAIARRYLEVARGGSRAIQVQMMAVRGRGWFDPPTEWIRQPAWQTAGPNLLPGPL